MAHRKGEAAWNKGLTKETDERVKKYSSCIRNPEWCNKISLSKIGKPRSEQTKLKISESCKEIQQTEETKLKRSNTLKIVSKKLNFGKWNKNRKFSKSHKENLRKKAVERILRDKIISIGRNETQLLDLQEQKDNCKILRQFNTGIGYITDGYCKESNTVYEIYEPHHDRQIFDDLNRETAICNHLSCDFIIIWDK